MATVLPPSPLQSLPGSLIVDFYSGKVYRATLDQSYLMRFLWNARLDSEKMAALHCMLSCGQDPGFPEEQVRRLLELKNWQQMTLSVLTQFCSVTVSLLEHSRPWCFFSDWLSAGPQAVKEHPSVLSSVVPCTHQFRYLRSALAIKWRSPQRSTSYCLSGMLF